MAQRSRNLNLRKLLVAQVFLLTLGFWPARCTGVAGFPEGGRLVLPEFRRKGGRGGKSLPPPPPTPLPPLPSTYT